MKAKLLSGKTMLVPRPHGGTCNCGGTPLPPTVLGSCDPTGADPSGIY